MQDRMFEVLEIITINVDIITLHFRTAGTKSFKYIPAKQIHRKRKVSE